MNNSELAAAIARRAILTGQTVACAESLTGGQISTRLAAATNASTWFHAGILSYTARAKHRILGVPVGPVVTAACAEQMAIGVRALTHADLALGITGVGGPGSQEGHPAGTTFLAITHHSTTTVQRLLIPGSSDRIIELAVTHSLTALLRALT